MLENGSSWQKMMKYLSAGTEFIIIFGLFLFGGLMLDRWIDTLPAFTLTGAVVGFAMGLYRLVKEAKQAQKDFENKRPAGRDKES